MTFIAKKNIVLASQSPRRKALLEQVGIPFEAVPSNIEEVFVAYPSNIHQYATDLAIEKAQLIAAENSDELVVIGADTLVTYEGRVFPKPINAMEAKTFLEVLSGQTYEVITAVAIIEGSQVHTFTSEAQVTFYRLEESLIDLYVASGDPLDKAGAYGIQSSGALFVDRIEGDYYTVMGLPIAQLSRVLQKLDVIRLDGSVMA